MKKTIITALALSLILALTAGCGGSPDDGSVPGGNEGGSSGEVSTVAGTSDTANAGTANTGTTASGASNSGASQTSASKPSGTASQNGGGTVQPSVSSQLESAFVISTEYAEIHYPEKWDGKARFHGAPLNKYIIL